MTACGTTGTGPHEALVVADLYTPSHSISEAGFQPYMKQVEKQSGGRLSFDYRDSEQLIAVEDNPWAVRTGAADVANILYMDSQMPLMYVPQLPGLFEDRNVVGASKAFWKYVQSNRRIQSDFRKWNMKPLFCFTTTNYQMQFSDKSVDSVSKLSGKQIRAAGTILPHSIEATGAISTDLNAAEAYDAFNRGVIDGLSLSVTSMRDYSFYELIESAVIGVDLGAFPVCYTMNLDRWNALPREDRHTLEEAGDRAVVKASTQLRDQVTSEIEQWKRDGIDVHTAERSPRLKAELADVEGEWTDQLVGDGMKRETVEDAIAQWKRLLSRETKK
ncbi:TRAP transporter substrate-binding protein DctP [Streptomyces albidus (ex Kaewkla and Franco 2022)]|uniref:TRAP transporter substrate-binding protein DctP n=1 Tax=Streptomyces albidus (ex Kaewkla and Franco 2022) TaxID=722709 RepID=UPI0015EF237F|nr:TRAP transporter substrate-binding protein DctP [Streptomyces albidus (ex Kaewkla and Franco 2022)]